MQVKSAESIHEHVQSFRVAAVQMVSSTSVQDNLEQADVLIHQAAQAGAQLVVLPEYFFLMGRDDTDRLTVMEAFKEAGENATEHTPLQDFLRQQAMQHNVWLAGGTIPLQTDRPEHFYNTTLVFNPQGERCARYDKIHLFGFRKNTEDGVQAYDEGRTILAGSRPQHFTAPCGRVGLSICYDLRFPELYRAFVPANLMLVPSAFTYATGSKHWEVLLRARAIENQCYVLAAAQGGKHENGRRTWGHSMLIDPWGEIVDCLPQGAGVVTGIVDPQRLREVRQSLPVLQHRVL